ncbi:MAG: SMI1/KNR4 family protein [Propionibacteriaceae bacterium]|nr:SMI1/KNR4 family protein [Propionibacteriaceae bacterium]
MKLDALPLDGLIAGLSSVLAAEPDAATATATLSWSDGLGRMQLETADAAGEVVGDPDWDALMDAFTDLDERGIVTDGVLELSLDRDGHWNAQAATGDPTEVTLRTLQLEADPVPLPPLEPAQATELADLWERGADDYEAQPGADDAALAALAEALGQPVPEQLAALLRLVDGAEVELEEDEDWDEDAMEEAYARTLTAGWSLLSADEIAEEHARWSTLALDPVYGGVAFDLGPDGLTQPRLAHPGWIPFAHDFGGNHLALDTVPGPAGTPGQVLEFGRDLNDGPRVRASSLLDFLAGRRNEEPDRTTDAMVTGEGDRALEPADVDPDTQGLRIFSFGRVDGRVIATAGALKLLLIRGAGTVDLTGLEALPLQDIRLIDLERVDLGPLADHPTLRLVTLENVAEVAGADVLATLPALEQARLVAPTHDVLAALSRNPTLAQVELDQRQGTPLAELVEQVRALDATTDLAVDTASGTVGR